MNAHAGQGHDLGAAKDGPGGDRAASGPDAAEDGPEPQTASKAGLRTDSFARVLADRTGSCVGSLPDPEISA